MKLKQALLHNTGWKIITMLFTFLNNIIIVRMLGVERSGDFFYALAVFTLLSTVLRLGLENGIVYFISKDPGKTKPITILLLIVLFIQAIVAFIVLHFFIKEVSGYTLFSCVLFVMSNVIIYYVSAFYQVKRMYISLNVSGTVMVFLQMLVLYYIYKTDTDFFMLSGFAKNKNDALLLISGSAILLQMLLLCIYFYKQQRTDFNILSEKKAVIKNIFRYSIINFSVTVLFFLTLRADLYFVEKYCNKVSLGNYLQAAKIGQMLLVFPGLIGGVIFPFTINAAKALAEKVALLCRLLTVLFIIIFIGFLLFGRFVFVWLLGAEFNLMYNIFAASFLGIYSLSISVLLISYFEGINKQVVILKALLLAFILLIILDCFLVPRYGYMAAAAIFSFANFVAMFTLVKNFMLKTGFKVLHCFLPNLKDINTLKNK